jgi:hypothetical protein
MLASALKAYLFQQQSCRHTFHSIKKFERTKMFEASFLLLKHPSAGLA